MIIPPSLDLTWGQANSIIQSHRKQLFGKFFLPILAMVLLTCQPWSISCFWGMPCLLRLELSDHHLSLLAPKQMPSFSFHLKPALVQKNPRTSLPCNLSQLHFLNEVSWSEDIPSSPPRPFVVNLSLPEMQISLLRLSYWFLSRPWPMSVKRGSIMEIITEMIGLSESIHSVSIASKSCSRRKMFWQFFQDRNSLPIQKLAVWNTL